MKMTIAVAMGIGMEEGMGVEEGILDDDAGKKTNENRLGDSGDMVWHLNGNGKIRERRVVF